MFNKIIQRTILIVAIVALIIASISSVAFILLKNKEIENEARAQCAAYSKYEVVDGDATVSYPVPDLYQECLEEKGIN